MSRNVQRWVRLDTAEINDFPALSIQDLKNIMIGTYQIHLAPSYVQDKLRHDEDEEFQIEMLQTENRLPLAGFMRVRVHSRFCNVTTQPAHLTSFQRLMSKRRLFDISC